MRQGEVVGQVLRPSPSSSHSSRAGRSGRRPLALALGPLLQRLRGRPQGCGTVTALQAPQQHRQVLLPARVRTAPQLQQRALHPRDVPLLLQAAHPDRLPHLAGCRPGSLAAVDDQMLHARHPRGCIAALPRRILAQDQVHARRRVQHSEGHGRADLGLAFHQQVDDLAIGQRQAPDGVGQALPLAARSDQVGVAGANHHDLAFVDAEQRIGPQQMADKGLVVHEELEGGIAPKSLIEGSHGGLREFGRCRQQFRGLCRSRRRPLRQVLAARSSDGQRILTRQRASAPPADRAGLTDAAFSVFGIPLLPASRLFANGREICGLGAARCGVSALAVLQYHERCYPAAAAQ